MSEKNVEGRFMRARAAIATLLAATVALPLTGCFGLPGLDDVADQAEDFASQAQELADTLSNVDWGKVSRLVVRDAQAGEVIREVIDQTEIEHAFEPFSEENGIATEPDDPESTSSSSVDRRHRSSGRAPTTSRSTRA